MRPTLDDLRYDPETHTSSLPDGTEVPHVTAILQEVGLTSSFENVPRHVLLTAGMRGRAVHEDCHAYDDEDLDIASADMRVLPYVEAWAEFRANHRLTPLSGARERRLFHPVFRYTGIMDGVFRSEDGETVLVDIKTGDPHSAAADLQTAAYEAAYTLETGTKIDRRVAVWLVPHMVVPYRVFDYSAMDDAMFHFQKFLACLTVYNEIRARRTRG